jgi:hypothetical protein
VNTLLNRMTGDNRKIAAGWKQKQTVISAIVKKRLHGGLYLELELPEELLGILMHGEISFPDMIPERFQQDPEALADAINELALFGKVRVLVHDVIDLRGTEPGFIIVVRLY